MNECSKKTSYGQVITRDRIIITSKEEWDPIAEIIINEIEKTLIIKFRNGNTKNYKIE